jgi:uncharacterized protein (TIGR02145 family)
MKLSKTILACLLITSAIIISSCEGSRKDQEGRSIKSIKIGDQNWMAENLNVSHFRNGDTIPEVKTSAEWIKMGTEGKPAWCYIENKSDNGSKFGKLYNWFAIIDSRGLAPEGWHVATDEEWTQLVNFLGGGVLAALKMRNTGLTDDLNSVTEGGFSGPPGGIRNSFGVFYGLGSYGYWWTASEFGASSAYLRILSYVSCAINFQNYDKICGASVRCIRD